MVLERKLALDDNDVYCPVRATLALLGQKWVPHIIHELMSGKRRFNELAHNVGGCNSRTLCATASRTSSRSISSRATSSP